MNEGKLVLYNDRSIMTALMRILEAYLQSNYELCLHWIESPKNMIEYIKDQSYKKK